MRTSIRPRQILIAVILLAVVIRVAAAFYLGDQVVELPGTADQVSYHNLALRVLAGHGFTFDKPWWPATPAGAPTAHWSYLYTFYLVFVYGLFGPHPLAARLIQVMIVGIAQPYLAYLIANRVFPGYGGWVGVVAAGLTAVYTYFIYYSGALMTEAFFFTTILAGLYLAILLVDCQIDSDGGGKKPTRKYQILLSVSFGLSLGAAVLLRQLYLIFIPLLYLWIWWSTPGRRRQTLFSLFISGLIIFVLVIPFTLYNFARFHRFVLLNTNAGFVLYWANHPVYGTRFIPILPSEEYLRLIPRELRRLDEAALDRVLLSRGIQFILDDPVRYGLLSLSRIPVLFEFWPSRDDAILSNVARLGGFGLFLPFMFYGVVLSIVKLRRSLRSIKEILSSPVIPLYLFVVFYTLLHVLIWALVRYRLPVDAVLVIFAGLAVVDLSRRLFGKRFPALEDVPGR